MLTRISWLIPIGVLLGGQAAYAQQACEALVNVKLPYTLITSAVSVAEGAAPAAPAASAAPPAVRHVPAHCDVRGVIRPSRDSEIKFALWLPAASAWNGKYRQQGNGGWAGASQHRRASRSHCAAVTPWPATDDGHEGGGGRELGHRPSGKADRLRVSRRA